MEIMLQNFNTHTDLHRRITGIFNIFDADGSGQLDYYEFRDGLRKLPLERPIELKPSDWVLLTAHLKDDHNVRMAKSAHVRASSNREDQRRSILDIFTRSESHDRDAALRMAIRKHTHDDQAVLAMGVNALSLQDFEAVMRRELREYVQRNIASSLRTPSNTEAKNLLGAIKMVILPSPLPPSLPSALTEPPLHRR